MASFWIGDAYGRVLGPLGLELVQDLIGAGRLQGITRVSTDGTTWADVATVPQIAELQAAQSGEVRRGRDLAEAARLGVELERLRERPPHEVFGLAAEAPVERWRAEFFALVKQFYPERLDPNASPELRRVCAEIFTYLSELMAFIERHPPAPGGPGAPAASAPGRTAQASSSSGALPVSPTPVPAPRAAPARGPHGAGAFKAPTPAPTPPRGPEPRAASSGAAAPARRTTGPQSVIALPATDLAAAAAPATAAATAAPGGAEPPSYAMTEFIGFERRDDDIVQANVRVTAKNCGLIFTDNRLFNIATSVASAFIPCPQVQPLGSRIEVRFFFEDPPREVSGRGIVVSWNAGDGRQPRGFGLSFTRLAKADLAFIREWAARAAPSRP